MQGVSAECNRIGFTISVLLQSAGDAISPVLNRSFVPLTAH